MKKSLLKLALGIVVTVFGLTSFAQTYTFTNCGATGQNGPNQGQVNTTYTGPNTLTGAVTINTQGIQEWIVPSSGQYKIEAFGAEGGRVLNNAPILGGRGVVVSGEVNLTAGTKIYIIVGQKGGTSNVEFPGTGDEGAGGGGSFVATGSALLTSTPIMVAGGGAGGTQPYLGPGNGLDASTSNTGVSGNSGGAGGVSGNGGANGSAGGPYFSSGGGGFNTDGEGGQGGFGGVAFINGGIGGTGGNGNLSYSNSNDRIDGGFGSGGSARGNSYCGGGGGGGYSGGGAGGSDSPRQGGGGGSFILSTATNVSTSDGLYNGVGTLNGAITNLNSWNLGVGQVIITYLCSLPAVAITAFSPDTVCVNDPAITLPVATPTNGTYSGNGVSGTTFAPSVAGVGSHYVTYTYTDSNSCSASDSTLIVVESCVGIDEANGLAGINIYPNPANDVINVSLANITTTVNFTLTSIYGKVVYNLNNTNNTKVAIDISNNSKGVYFLKIETNNKQQIFKVIKQ